MYKKILIFFVFIFLLLISVKYDYFYEKESYIPSQSSFTHVVFDQSMNQVSSPFDTGFDGLSILSALLRNHGATVSINNEPLKKFLPTIHGPGYVLVLGLPWEVDYAEAAVSAVNGFLDSGGGVLVITEHDNIYNNADIQNQLIESHGIKVMTSHTPMIAEKDALTGVDIEKMWPECHVDRWQLSNIQVFLAAPIEIKSPAEKLLEVTKNASGNEVITAALNQSHKGPLVVISDLEIFWNMTKDSGIRAGNNSEFMLHLFGLLSGKKAKLIRAELNPKIKEKWMLGKKVALFETSGNGLFPDGSPNGLHNLAEQLNQNGFKISVGNSHDISYENIDLVILAVPVETIKNQEEIQKAKKLLFIADGRADLLAHIPELESALQDYIDIPNNDHYPLNDLAEEYGFQFMPVTLLSRETSNIQTSAKSTDDLLFDLYRSTIIDLFYSSNRSFSVLAYADEDSIPVLGLLKLTNMGEMNINRFPSSEQLLEIDYKKMPVVMKSSKIFAVSDLELFIDQGFEKEHSHILMNELMSWLNN